jgi:hypothetical protein
MLVDFIREFGMQLYSIEADYMWNNVKIADRFHYLIGMVLMKSGKVIWSGI